MQQELNADTDLAALDAELLAINAEDQARNQAAERTRQLTQALGGVKDAEENLRRLTVELQKYDVALAALRKVRKGVDAIPAQTVGGRPSLNAYSTRVTTEVLDDLGDHLQQILNASLPLIQQRRDRTVESITKTEARLAEARTEALKLK